jgi:hypothetical protein
MKTFFFILLTVSAFYPAFSQEIFTVPELTDAAKHQRSVFMANYCLMAGAAVLKQQGLSIEDYANNIGDLVKTTWNKDGGYDHFVRGTLYNWESFRNSVDAGITIIKQTDYMIQFTVPINYKMWFEKGNIHEVSFDDLIMIYNVMHNKIAEYLGVEYEQKLLNDGTLAEITIAKK